jgi:hypothetical protein
MSIFYWRLTCENKIVDAVRKKEKKIFATIIFCFFIEKKLCYRFILFRRESLVHFLGKRNSIHRWFFFCSFRGRGENIIFFLEYLQITTMANLHTKARSSPYSGTKDVHVGFFFVQWIYLKLSLIREHLYLMKKYLGMLIGLITNQRNIQHQLF